MTLVLVSGLVCLLWSTWWLFEKNEIGIRRYRQSKSNLVFLFLPGLINLAAFYSLALHMYLSLDGWADFGRESLSDTLYVHYALIDDLSFFYFLFISFGSFWAALDYLLSNQANQTLDG